MTDIGKDKVERFEPDVKRDLRDRLYGAMERQQNGDWVRYTEYATLSARVGELSADFEDAVLHLHSYKKRVSELEVERDTARERGRLQGLDEAVEFLRTRPQTSQLVAIREAIEALKGKNND